VKIEELKQVSRSHGHMKESENNGRKERERPTRERRNHPQREDQECSTK